MKLIKKIDRFYHRMSSLPQKINSIQEAIGRIETRQNRQLAPSQITESEFKVFSQWGEDGIIQFLVKNIPIENRIFIEFGVEDYIQSNTRFLLVNDNWSGLVIDGSLSNIEYIKNDSIYWGYNLKAECAFITSDNINDLFIANGIRGDIGLLSVDIDGNDYWVWEAIKCINPRIVVCEYNSLFGPHAKVTIPYDPNFYRGSAHYSKVYYGASISALNYLAEKKGYLLVGSNNAGNNAFFVRKDLIGTMNVLSPLQAYKKAQFREAKNTNDELTYAEFNANRAEISMLEVICVESSKLIKIGELKF